MSDLLVFTSGDNTSLLRRSCEAVGIALAEIVAPWTDYVDIKLRKAIDFLIGRPEPYCMWVDGNDTLVLKSESEILARLHALGDPVMTAAECNCWPDPDKAEVYLDLIRYYLTDQPLYINAGGFIGPKHNLLTVMHTVLSVAKTGDDQRAWTDAYLAGMIPQMQIDHGRHIFSCAGDGKQALMADTCMMHFNGHVPGREEYWTSCKK
jgi:hypothetical protein